MAITAIESIVRLKENNRVVGKDKYWITLSFQKCLF